MLRGDIKDFALTKLVQLVCSGRRAAKLAITRADEKGEIYFARGAVIHARLGNEVGPRAFRKIANWPDGEFMLEYGITAEARTIDIPLWCLFSDEYFDEAVL